MARPVGSNTRQNVFSVLNTLRRARAPMGLRALAAKTGLSKQTINRTITDIDVFWPVEITPDPSHSQRKLYRLEETAGGTASSADLMQLVGGITALRGAPLTGLGLAEELDTLLDEHSQGQNPKFQRFLRELRAVLVENPLGEIRYQDVHQDVLFEFVEARVMGCAVRAEYQSPHTKKTRVRLLALSRIFLNDGALYLIVRDVEENKLLVTALHRYQSIAMLRDTTASVNDREADAFIDSNFGAFLEDPVDVRLRVSAQWAAYYMERRWFRDQHVEHNMDGSLSVAVRGAGKTPMFQHVLSQAPHVRIESPAAWDDDLRAMVAQIWSS